MYGPLSVVCNGVGKTRLVVKPAACEPVPVQAKVMLLFNPGDQSR